MGSERVPLHNAETDIYVHAVRKTQFILSAAVVAVLAPFLNKAFHIDDPLFLWMAQQIARHPLDPYGFTVNWASIPEPFWAQMQNPPLCSYFIAGIATLAGWTEPVLHLAFLSWAILSILGTFALARRFCRDSVLAPLLVLFAPVFLVSATNVMCDVMLLAFWVWSLEFWLRGLERNRWWLFAASASSIAAALLTKYYGVTLIPLLAAYTLLRDWRKWPRLIFFLVPIAVAAAYELWTKSLYGRGLLSAAMFFAHGASMKFGQGISAQSALGLAFTGGCIVAPLIFLQARARSLMIAIATIAACIAVFYLTVPIDPGWALGQNVSAVRLEGGIFVAIGFAVVALAIADVVRKRDAESALLLLWMLGTFGFATFFNWSVTARTILPMAPAAAILLVRFLERTGTMPGSSAGRYWRIGILAAISLGVTVADYCQANSAREAANEFQQRFRGESGTLWFQSHWGFQYYMQRFGSTPFDSGNPQIASRDVIVIPANSTFTIPISPERVFPPEEVNFPVVPFLSTAGRGTGACFYSSIRGPLPWVIDQVPPEMYYVARFR